MNIKSYAKYLIITIIVLSISFMFIFYFILYPLKFKSTIKDNAIKYDIKPYIIASIINTESSFNVRAKSGKGAIGLMQLMPKTAKWICEIRGLEYNEEKLYQEEFNINLGCYYFRYLLNKFNNIDTVIVCYNAGEGITKSWLGNKEYSPDGISLIKIPYKETENYLKRVKSGIKFYYGRI